MEKLDLSSSENFEIVEYHLLFARDIFKCVSDDIRAMTLDLYKHIIICNKRLKIMNEQTKLINPRNSALEGLRGVFCIAVFNSHIIPNFYPEIMNSGTWKVVMNTPLYLFFSGGAGISFFALLIGMTFMGNLQSESYFVMLKKCIKRYFKFVIIILVCDNLYWIFSYFGLLYCVPGTEYQDIVYFPKIDIVLPYWRVFTDSSGRIFFKGTSSFVAPFHTIGDLYWGAWIVLALYSFLLKIKNILDHKLFFVFGNITCLVWSMLFFWLGKNIFFECIIGLWSMMFYEYFQNKQEINSSRKRNSNIWSCSYNDAYKKR